MESRKSEEEQRGGGRGEGQGGEKRRSNVMEEAAVEMRGWKRKERNQKKIFYDKEDEDEGRRIKYNK